MFAIVFAAVPPPGSFQTATAIARMIATLRRCLLRSGPHDGSSLARGDRLAASGARTAGRTGGAGRDAARRRQLATTPRRRRARPRSGSRCRSACGCSASRARPAPAWTAACARRRRPSGRRGPSRSPTRAGRSPRAAAPGPRPRRAAGSARTRAASARPTRRPRRPGTGRPGSRPRRSPIGPFSTRTSARLRRRTTASTRAISSSGWHGLVTQSSAPSRSPRTRWATEDWPVHTTTPRCGRRVHSLSR